MLLIGVVAWSQVHLFLVSILVCFGTTCAILTQSQTLGVALDACVWWFWCCWSWSPMELLFCFEESRFSSVVKISDFWFSRFNLYCYISNNDFDIVSLVGYF